MKNQYANHPLLPLHGLLLSIHSAEEFKTRQAEILEAIHLAAPVLRDRTRECCSLAKSPYLKRQGAHTTPIRMAYFVESTMKQTLHLITSANSPNTRKTTRKPKATVTAPNPAPAHIPTMNYSDLRAMLPTRFTTNSLGGRTEIEFHNPAFGHLMAINSRGNAYHVSEADWNNARILRAHNPHNPWATKHYSELSAYTSYGLIHAAALLRHVQEHGLAEMGDCNDRLPNEV